MGYLTQSNRNVFFHGGIRCASIHALNLMCPRLRLFVNLLQVPSRENVGVALKSVFMGKAEAEAGVMDVGIPFGILFDTQKDF